MDCLKRLYQYLRSQSTLRAKARHKARQLSHQRRELFRPLGESLEMRRLLDADPCPSLPACDASFDWFDEAPPQAPMMGPTRDTGGELRWIVRLKDSALTSSTSLAEVSGLLVESPGVSVVRGLGKPGLVLVQGPRESNPSVEDSLSSNPNVAYFERDGKIEPQRAPNDPEFPKQYGLDNTGQTGGTAGADIDATGAWEQSIGGREVVVAILDTGVDLTHPDLADNLWSNPRESGLDEQGNDKSTNGLDDDQNGFVDDVHGYDFVNGRFDPRTSSWSAAAPQDDNGHGTHVAGIIGAVGDNGVGISGVAWRTSLMPLKFLGATNDGFVADAVRAIQYVVRLRRDWGVNVRVLNNSWVSKEGYSAALQEAIDDAAEQDILIVASAGNGNAFRRGNNNDTESIFPASYPSDHILSVAASDNDGSLVPYYNFGPISVDLAAPGLDIYSTVLGGGYDYRSGTSMAAPHVSGVAALIFSHASNDVTALEVRKAITSSVDPLPTTFEQELIATGGRLNAQRALTIDTFAPRSSLTQASSLVTVAGGTDYPIEIRFEDNRQIDSSSIDNQDVVVRRLSDGATFSTVPRDMTIDDSGKSVTVTYHLTPPGGAWDNLDNGRYEILFLQDQVRDTAPLSNAARPSRLGEFNVDVLDAGQFRVNTSVDSVDANPGDGFALDANGDVSLRAAIMEANALPGPSTIFLAADQYWLRLQGAGEDQGLRGDLDIRDDVTIAGVGGEQDLVASNLGGGRVLLSGAQDLVTNSPFGIFRSLPDPDGLVLEFSIFDIIQLPAGNRIGDGERFTISSGGMDQVFEFDADAVGDDLAPGIVGIHISPLDDPDLLAGRIKQQIAKVFPNVPLTQLDSGRIRFDSQVQLDLALAPSVTFLSRFVGTSILDGLNFDLRNGNDSLRFEFDSNGVTEPGANPIAFSQSSTNAQAVDNLVAAINTSYASRIAGNSVINGMRSDRVFDVRPGARLTLRNLAVRDGFVNGDGGGVRNEGELFLENVRVEKNEASALSDGEFLMAAGLTGKSEARAVGRDSQGNIFVAGYFEDTISFPSDAGKIELTSRGDRDIFVGKLSAVGKVLWARSFGSDWQDEAQSLEVDRAGNVFVTGHFQLNVDFGTDPQTPYVLSSDGQEDAFMLQLDANGGLMWANRFGGSQSDTFMGSALDSDGNIYLSGFAGSNPRFGWPALESSQAPAAIVVKLNSLGVPQWTAPFHGDFVEFRFPPDIAYGIDVDAARNVYVSGAFIDTVDFDPQSTDVRLTSAGGSDLFLTKLDATGALVWAQAIGGALDEVAGDVAVMDDGTIHIAGGFNSRDVDFDVGAGETVLTGNSPNARTFVAKFDTLGDVQWARELGAHPGITTNFAALPGQNTRVQVDDAGHVYVADRFDVNERIAIDLSSGEDRIPEFRNGFYVHKMDSAGETIATFVSSDADAPTVGSLGLSVDRAGIVSVSGGIWGQNFDDRFVDLNPDDAVETLLTSTGQPSAFAATFRLPSQSASARGAGVFSTGRLEVRQSEIVDNRAHSFASRSLGGGIYAAAQLVVADSTFEGNQASNGGGLFLAGADAEMAHTIWQSNKALNAGGALVASFSDLDMTEVQLLENSAMTGGAIFSRGSNANVAASTIAENVGRSAWYDDDSTIRLDSSTVNDHRSTAMEANRSRTTVINSTITNNDRGLMLSQESTVISSTVTNNGTGVAYAAVKNSIVADNWEDIVLGGSSLGGNIIGYAASFHGFVDGVNGDRVGDRRGVITEIISSGSPFPMVSAGHGLTTGDVVLAIRDDGTTFVGNVIVYDSDIFSLEVDFFADRWMTQLDPRLGPLNNNGGPTRTHLPLNHSPAIDHGIDDGSAIFDQRGFPRPQDGNEDDVPQLDAGAVEVSHGAAIGLVFADFNANGLFDPEDYALEGWRVFADLNDNGIFDPAEPNTRTVGDLFPFEDPFVWLSRGEFYLPLLPAGDYALRVVPEPNWIVTSPADGGFDVSVAPGEDLTDIRIGYFPRSGSISGHKYHDLDGDGHRDEEDLGLPGWRIFFDENLNGEFDEGEHFAISNDRGDYTVNYEFQNLRAGTYPLMEEPQAGWNQITPSPFVDAVDYDFTTDNGLEDPSQFKTITFEDGGFKGNWHLTTARGNDGDPDHAFYFGSNESPDQDGYVLGNARGTLISPLIDLRRLSGTLQLTFDSLLDLDSIDDLAQVAVLINGHVVVLANSRDGSLEIGNQPIDYSHERLDLSPFAGHQIQLIFEFQRSRQKIGGDQISANLTEDEEYFLRVARLDGVGSGDYDVVVSSVGPDLALRDVTVLQATDSQLVYRYAVVNEGSRNVEPGTPIQVLAAISADDQYGNGDDVAIGGDTLTEALAPLESVTRVITVDYQADLTRPRLLLNVDGTDVVREFNESNNVLSGYLQAPLDRLEPNDSFAQAVPINANPAATVVGLSIHNVEDADYFSYVPPAVGEVAVVAVHYAPYRGQMNLAVYDEQQYLVSSSFSIRDDHTTLSFIPLTAGTHYIKVTGFDSGTNPAYTLVINSTEPPDRHESNDTFETATPTTGGREERLTIHANGDRDLFRFIPPTSGSREVRIQFERQLGDLQLRLYDAGRNQVAESNYAADFESIEWDFVGGEAYYVEVIGVDGATSPEYSLRFLGHTLPDRFEPNDSVVHATDWGRAGFQQHTNLTIDSANDEDYFRIVADDSAEYNFQLAFDDTSEAFDVFLYDSSGKLIQSTLRQGWFVDNVVVTSLGHYRVDLQPGVDYYQYDFGNQSIEGATGAGLNGKIAGILFDDRNGNRLRDLNPDTAEFEPVLAGRKVFLDLDNNGIHGDREPFRISDANGLYEFNGLGSGVYNVLYETQPEQHQTFPVRNRLTQLQEVKTGNRPQEVSLADFNGDEHLDLAVANSEQNNIAIFFNNKAGLFENPRFVSIASGPQGLAEGDLDRDGDLDLVASSLLGERLTVLTNDGSGSFAITGDFPIPNGAFSVAIAQLNDDNNDGRIDAFDFADILATEKSRFDVRLPALPAGKLHLFFGDPSGTYSDHRTINVGVDPASVVAAHLNDDNGDGQLNALDRLDLVIANFGDPIPTYRNHTPQAGSVTVLRNDGDRNFSPFEGTGNHPTGNGSYSIEAADIDSDDDLDLIVVDGISDGLSILRNLGGGTLGPREIVFLGVKATSVTARDLDDDGDVDMAISNGQSDGVVILHNDGLGGYRSLGVLGVADFPKSYSFSVTTGDVDDDGTLDFAVARGLASEVTVLRNEVVSAPHRLRLGVDEQLANINFGSRPDDLPPTGIALTPSSIPEDSDTSGGLVIVGRLQATGDNQPKPHQFTLVSGPGDTDNASVVLQGADLAIRQGIMLDHEVTPTLSIRVEVFDGEHRLESQLTLTVADRNDAPFQIDIAPSSVLENVSGAPVGRLSARDQDTGQSHLFALGDDRFELAGNDLKLKAGEFLSLDDGGTTTVMISVTDSGSPPRSHEQMIVLSLLSNPRPWRNPILHLDATGDQQIAPLDALVVINEINEPTVIASNAQLPRSRSVDSLLPYFDINGDGFCTAIDVLEVFNFLNGEGEGELVVAPAPSAPEARMWTELDGSGKGSYGPIVESSRTILAGRGPGEPIGNGVGHSVASPSATRAMRDGSGDKKRHAIVLVTNIVGQKRRLTGVQWASAETE